MADSAPAETDVSPNLHKYATKNRLYQWHLNEFMDAMCALVGQTEPQTLLDAGCGEGFAAARLADRFPGVKITGIDASESAIRFAEKHFGERARFRTGSIYRLPFSDRSFDTVLCSEVLEHLEEPDAAVAELKRVARRAVVITVPREPYFQWLNNVGQWIGVSPDPGHVNFWDRDGFQAFIRRHFEEPTFAWKHTYQLALARV